VRDLLYDFLLALAFELSLSFALAFVLVQFTELMEFVEFLRFQFPLAFQERGRRFPNDSSKRAANRAGHHGCGDFGHST